MVKQKKARPNRRKWWLIAISTFVIVQFIFFMIDGTSLEPRLNDLDNMIGRAADWLLESKIFNEWITPYSFPWFNLAMTLFVIVLLINAIIDIFTIKKQNNMECDHNKGDTKQRY